MLLLKKWHVTCCSCVPLLHIWRALAWSNVKNWWYRGSNRYHQCPLKGGREGGVEKACILPALAAPSWFHLIVGEPLGAHMILVVWRHAQYMIETHFWIPHPRFTFALIPRLGLVAINRGGLDHPAGTCWLANPPQPTPAPNAMSQTCHIPTTTRHYVWKTW